MVIGAAVLLAVVAYLVLFTGSASGQTYINQTYLGQYSGTGAYNHTYSTGIVAPGFQLQLGPVVTIRRPAVQYRYVPANPYARPLGGAYGASRGVYAPAYVPVYRPSYLPPRVSPYVSPSVNIYVR